MAPGGASGAARARAPERSARWATLDVLVAPWARVRIDGEERGQTPLKELRVPVGARLLEIFNPELGKLEKLKLRPRGGEHMVIRRDWTR
jgi:hypothetical protein